MGIIRICLDLIIHNFSGLNCLHVTKNLIKILCILTAIKLDDKLPFSLEPKCSITCQLLFLMVSPVPPWECWAGLEFTVEDGVDRDVLVFVSLKSSPRGFCLRLVHFRAQPLLNELTSWKKKYYLYQTMLTKQQLILTKETI